MPVPRRAGWGAALFAIGLTVGLAAAAFSPLNRGRPQPAEAVIATPAAAVAEPPEECTPAPLARRASQLLVMGLPGVTAPDDPLADELLQLGVGGVFLTDSNVVDAAQVQALTAALHDATALPLLVTTDEEAGRVSTFRSVIGGTSAPRTLAAVGDAESVREFAAELGAKLADLGVTVDLAPVADLDAGPWNGVIGDRSFSADPLIAAEYALAFAQGLSDAGVLPVVKHFPGHGRGVDDVHSRAARVDAPLDELLATDVLPFVSLIDAGAPIVMMSHVQYDALQPGRPASLSPAAYQLLRDLGFNGVAMTDSVGMGAIHRRWDFGRAAVMAVRAGADAVLATDGRHAAEMRDAIVRAVRRGRLDEARVDEAVARMLALKGLDPSELTCVEAPPVPVLAAVYEGR